MGSIAHEVFKTPGYSLAFRLEADELAALKRAIETQWLDRITEAAPEHAAVFAAAGMSGYHRHAHLVDHKGLWPKQFRVLPPAAVARVLAFPLMDRLREALGPFRVAEQVWENRVTPGTHEVYWRLVRPGVQDDVGPLHRDKWFHENVSGGQGQFAPDEVTVKLWIAIETEAGRNGLLLVPDSHSADVDHARVVKDGVYKPQIGDLPEGLEPFLVPADPGTIVAFNEDLIHGGAINHGETTRVSAEITLVLPRRS